MKLIEIGLGDATLEIGGYKSRVKYTSIQCQCKDGYIPRGVSTRTASYNSAGVSAMLTLSISSKLPRG